MDDIDYPAMLDRALARRHALWMAIEDLNRRIDRRTRALYDVEDEIREYRRKIALEGMREAA
jgi:hypothetical protein